MLHFSVLLSIYYKENPSFLKDCFDSILSQTKLPDEIVLVEDGTLTQELDEIINEYVKSYSFIKTVKLKQNVGLGRALNEGLKHCSYDLVARMDTDDICKPKRFQTQLEYFVNHPEVDVVGTWIDEFIDTPANVVSTRKLPSSHDEILQFGKRRNPINHVTVMFKKASVMKVGSYQHFNLFEDYFLWVRMIMNGCKFYNINESLMYVRISSDMFKRRGGFKYGCTEASFQWTLYKLGYIGLFSAFKNICIRFTIRVIPNSLRGFVYKNFIRK